MKYANIIQAHHLLLGITKRFEIYQRGTRICKVPPFFNYTSVSS